jgi:hypothetical protein
MDTQAITKRLMVSLNSGDLIQDYLVAFGIIDLANVDLPPVFDPKYGPEWKAFNEQMDLDVRTGKGYDESDAKKRKKLYTVLEFLRYMKSMGINPFIRGRKLVINGKPHSPNPKIIFEDLTRIVIKKEAKAALNLVRKTSLLFHLKVTKSLIVVQDLAPNHVLQASYTLVPKRKESLDSILVKLQGLVYSRSQIPPELKDTFKATGPKDKSKLKSTRLTAEALMQVRNSLGWLPIDKEGQIFLHLIRAANDKLVMRLTVKLRNDYKMGTKHETHRKLINFWKDSFKLPT